MFCYFFCFKQKTAYEMRISDWSSDVCSSDLAQQGGVAQFLAGERFGLPGDRRVFGGGGEIGVEGEGTLLVVDGDGVGAERCQQRAAGHLVPGGDRKRVVEGKSVSVSVDLGGSRCMHKKT